MEFVTSKDTMILEHILQVTSADQLQICFESLQGTKKIRRTFRIQMRSPVSETQYNDSKQTQVTTTVTVKEQQKRIFSSGLP